MDQGEDTRPEPFQEQRGAGFTRFVLEGIMEERSNRFVLIAAIVLHESANTEKVGEDRDLALLSSVAAVKPHSIVERVLESGRQEIRQGSSASSFDGGAEGGQSGTDTVDPLEFLARVTAHIPKTHQVMTRYYGYQPVARLLHP